jgi:hypothetical protein
LHASAKISSLWTQQHFFTLSPIALGGKPHKQTSLKIWCREKTQAYSQKETRKRERERERQRPNPTTPIYRVVIMKMAGSKRHTLNSCSQLILGARFDRMVVVLTAVAAVNDPDIR